MYAVLPTVLELLEQTIDYRREDQLSEQIAAIENGADREDAIDMKN